MRAALLTTRAACSEAWPLLQEHDVICGGALEIAWLSQDGIQEQRHLCYGVLCKRRTQPYMHLPMTRQIPQQNYCVSKQILRSWWLNNLSSAILTYDNATSIAFVALGTSFCSVATISLQILNLSSCISAPWRLGGVG